MAKKAMVDHMKKQKNDELYTPEEAIKPLLRYIPSDLVIWECTDHGESNITRLLRDQGNKVISTHLSSGYDFLEDDPDFYFDCIVTNPPYSIKTDFLRRAYEFNKKFAFLLPITTLEGQERGELFKKYGIEVLVLNKRINFMKTKKNVWFNTSWFTHNILPDRLVFSKVDK